MTDEFAIRRYRPAQKNAVWAVHDRAFRASPVEFLPDMNRYLRRIPEFFLEPGGEFLVATVPVPPGDPSGSGATSADPPDYGPDDERVVGVGGYLPSTAEGSSVRPGAPVDPDEGTAEVRSVRVDPDFQRRGIGRTLVRELEDRAREAGFERMVLDTGAGMEPARALYRSLGYERAGTESIDGFELVHFEREL